MQTTHKRFSSLRRSGVWGVFIAITALMWCSIAWSFGGAEEAVAIAPPGAERSACHHFTQ
ncbi:hypothetical protein [Ewingella americana]